MREKDPVGLQAHLLVLFFFVYRNLLIFLKHEELIA